MREISLIANTGIHMTTFQLELDLQANFKMWYHEWFDTTDERGQWRLEIVDQVNFEQGTAYYSKKDLRRKGYNGDIAKKYSYNELKDQGVLPIADDNGMLNGNEGEVFKMTFSDRHNTIEKFINVWLPAPFFFKRTATRYKFGSLNWARFKLIPLELDKERNKWVFNVLLAFDTRTQYSGDAYNECPVFPDQAATHMNFGLCDDESLLMDYCTPNPKWAYIDDYLMSLVHPGVHDVAGIEGHNVRKMSYAASYVYLINYIAKHQLFPSVELYKDSGVEVKDIDMIVDIGNSRTTALLIEDNKSFTQVPKLQLTNYTNPLVENESGSFSIRRHSESFDMRLAFRKVSFGNFGIQNSKQFVHPSFVRLGQEANELIHLATIDSDALQSLSTYSSPKRYLWDYKPNKEEWRFLTLEGEPHNTILQIEGLSEYLHSDGRINSNGDGGITYNYSRRTLMTFSFLEMLVQARTQINGYEHRVDRGERSKPRRIKRIIVTCPTAMSKVERESLINCAKEAVVLLSKFDNVKVDIDVVPHFKSHSDNDSSWYYDEATCAQLVYMYGEVGYKYKGSCSEFFNLYGKVENGEEYKSLTIASLDIGAGTTDLMISKYTYTKDVITRITPDPKFYDSFYYAGDDMLEALIKNLMFLSKKSAFKQQMRDISFDAFQQKMKDFVGPDYHGQTIQDRIMRRNFNIQYSVPLMCYFLELVKNKSKDCIVRYSDIFTECKPNKAILEDFQNRFGFSLETVEWEFNYDDVCEIIEKAFEPLLKKIATIMFAHSCDIILLSGRPASLQPIRDVLLKYYCVSPNRLILLNNYFIGDWYPYDNNTGYIVDAKPIVAIGAAVAHYASELSNLNNFIIMTDKLQANLKSTVNYIEATRDGLPIEYVINPNKTSGPMTVSNLPMNLNVRQLGIESYPARSLFIMDFDLLKIADMIKRQKSDNNVEYTSAELQDLVKRATDDYRMRMPFKVTIEREVDDKEALFITGIVDRFDREIPTGVIDLHIQSLGVDEKHWLDTGAFGF